MKKIINVCLLAVLLLIPDVLCAKNGMNTPTEATISNPFIFGNKRITLISPTLFRLEYALDGKFLDDPTMFAHDRSHLLEEYTIASLNEGKQYEITTPFVRIVADNDNLPFGQINTKVYFMMGGQEKQITARDLHSKTEKMNLGGSLATLDMVHGEVPLNDGLHSKDGWYYLIDTGKEVLKNGWVENRDRSHVQDQYCFVYGDDFKAPLRDLGLISGYVPMTRKYMHGVWYSRWWPFTDEEFYQLVAGYREKGFPLDVLSIDMDWHLIDGIEKGMGRNYTKGWTGYTWNTDYFPDPKTFIQNMLKDSIHICLNEHPHDGIRPHEIMYEDFMRDMGREPNGDIILFDAGDKKYMENYFKHTRAQNRDYGVAFWWMDWQQDWLFPYVRGTHMNHLSWINKLAFEDTKQDGKRGAGYSRWGGWGDHRNPIHFSGDATANWDVLAFEVKLSQTSGSAGCYYWAHDIGGFHGGTDPELLVRWTQFGALSAALRVHAARRADLDRRPWLWGDQATNAMRVAYSFRSEMMPYIYSSIWQTHKTMIPLNRPMYIEYNKDENSYNQYQQFMFGDLLLAAPITSAGKGDEFVAGQKVWFPGGNDWYDYFTDEKYAGNTTQVIEKPLHHFPVFVKGGYILPMQPFSYRPTSAPLNHLNLLVYPGNEGENNEYTLYEDDGESQEYETGKYATTTLNYYRAGNKTTLTIAPTEGEYQGQVTQRGYTIILGAVKNIKSVKVNNRKVKVGYDEKTGRYSIPVKPRSIRQATTIVIEE